MSINNSTFNIPNGNQQISSLSGTELTFIPVNAIIMY